MSADRRFLGVKTRVTQLDIARAARVHNATVSLALRNSPLISPVTRERIQEIADRLGYRPDPALRALVAYRKGLVVNHQAEPIAYVTSGTTRWGWREIATEEAHFQGAQRKAAEYGYQLEHFWLGEAGMTGHRLSNVLFHRGINGMLLATPAQTAGESFDFEWERLSAVRLGCFPLLPPLHRVANDAGAAIRLAVRKAVGAGYRRIGLILPDGWDESVDEAWSLGFAMEQCRVAAAPRRPAYLQQAPRLPLLDEAAGPTKRSCLAILDDWFSEFQPDIVLGSFAHAVEFFSPLGIQVPRDVAFVELLRDHDDPNLAGVCQNCERVGEVAIELLVGQLQRNLRGLPPVPTTTYLENTWADGASMPVPRADEETDHANASKLKLVETAA